MRIVEVRRLRGPNVYCSRPAVIALIDLQEFAGRETTEVPGFTERVLQLLPGLAEHHCAAQNAAQHVAAPFVARLNPIGNREAQRPDVIGNDAERNINFLLFSLSDRARGRQG